MRNRGVQNRPHIQGYPYEIIARRTLIGLLCGIVSSLFLCLAIGSVGLGVGRSPYLWGGHGGCFPDIRTAPSGLDVIRPPFRGEARASPPTERNTCSSSLVVCGGPWRTAPNHSYLIVLVFASSPWAALSTRFYSSRCLTTPRLKSAPVGRRLTNPSFLPATRIPSQR